MDDVITKFTAVQSSSEERFYELEEKCLKQEAALEKKRMALANERRKQELDHEMRLMVMMTQMFSRSACATYGAPPPRGPSLPPPEWGMSGYNMSSYSNQDPSRVRIIPRTFEPNETLLSADQT